MSQMMKRKQVQQHSVTSLNKKAEFKMAFWHLSKVTMKQHHHWGQEHEEAKK